MRCPKENLEVIISYINSFRNSKVSAATEPSIKETEKITKRVRPEITNMLFKKTVKKAFQNFVKEYDRNNKIVYFLSQYEDTRRDIIKNIKEHLGDCKKCREDYLFCLDKEAEKKLKWAHDDGMSDKKTKRLAQKILAKGYKILVKETDILGFLTKDNLYKA